MMTLRHFRWMAMVMVGLILSACNDGGGDSESHDFGSNDPNTVVALGDSITAGYPGGLVPYPAILSSMIAKRVVNAGVSGNTSGEAAARAGSLLSRHRPGYMLILVGSNDVITGLSPDQTVARIRGVIGLARSRQTIPIVATIPPMFGSHAIFNGRVPGLNQAIRDLARAEKVKLVDLERALNNEALFLPDGLHPNQEGHQRLATAFANAF